MILIGLLVLLGIFVFAVGGWDNFKAMFQPNSGVKHGASSDDPVAGASPEKILRERFARGEMSREEYMEATQVLAK